MRNWVALAVLLRVLIWVPTKPLPTEMATAQVQRLNPSGNAKLNNTFTLKSETIAISGEDTQFNHVGDGVKVKPEEVMPHVDKIVGRQRIIQDTSRLNDVATP